MTSVTIVQTNFTAGEVSPRMLGRVDVERYKNGAAVIQNGLPLIHGGVKNTPMLRFNAEAKYGNRKCRLIRFEFSKTEANMLEFGHEYIRFFNQDRTQVMSGPTPYEIASPYQESELFEIEYIGGADTVFLFHENHPVQRLRRFSNTFWALDEAPFDPQPFIEQGHRPAAALTLSAATVGSGRTFTAGASAFLPADVGRRITYQAGLALITAYTSATEVTATIEAAFSGTSIASGAWALEGSPVAILTPSKNGELGETIDLTLTTGVLYGPRLTIDSASWSADQITFVTLLAHDVDTGDIVRIEGCEPFPYNGTYEADNTAVSSTEFLVSYAPNPGGITVKGTVQKVLESTTVNGWRSTDVGSFVSVNGGLIEITGYSSGSTISGLVRQLMTADVSAQAGAWSLKQGIWNEANGYPRSGTFFQQRLCVGGTPSYPHSIANSRIGEYLNFEFGLNDDDAFMYTLDVAEYDPILHLAKSKNQIIALTAGNEFTVGGGIESPMTPSNTQVDNPSDYGCNDVRPIRVGNELVFVNRTGRKFRAIGYRLEQDSFGSTDLTKLSEHITEGGIVDLAYQQEPESIVWGIRADGVMVTMSIDRDEGVIAWARQTTDGEFESVESIPGADGADEVWVSVKRTIDGEVVRYIESYDAGAPYGLHSAISGTSEPGTDVWDGLDHLEGETVDIVADGVVMDSQVVVGGEVTLVRDAHEVFIGLPSRAYIKTLNPELITQTGSAQGNNIRIAKCTLRMMESVCVDIDGQYVDLRQMGSELLDQAAPTFTGDIDVSTLGWYRNGFVEIEQSNALPFHVLAVILKVSVNG